MKYYDDRPGASMFGNISTLPPPQKVDNITKMMGEKVTSLIAANDLLKQQKGGGLYVQSISGGRFSHCQLCLHTSDIVSMCQNLGPSQTPYLVVRPAYFNASTQKREGVAPFVLRRQKFA